MEPHRNTERGKTDSGAYRANSVPEDFLLSTRGNLNGWLNCDTCITYSSKTHTTHRHTLK